MVSPGDQSHSAGNVSLGITPNLSTFKQKLEAGLRPIKVEAKVQAVPSLQGFKTQLTRDLRAIVMPQAKVKAVADVSGLRADFRSKLTALPDFNVKVRAQADMTGFVTSLRAQLRALPAQSVAVNVRPNMAGFRQALRDDVDGVNAPNIRVRAELDFAVARAQLAAFRAEVGVPMSTQVHIDTAGALAQVAALRAAVRDIADDGISGRLSSAGGGAGGGAAGGRLRQILGAPVRQVRLQIEVDRSSVASAEAEIANLGDRIRRARVKASDAADGETAARQRLSEVRSGGGAGTSAETRAQAALTRATRASSEASAEASRLLGRQADAHHRLRQSQNDQNSISRLVSAGFRGIGEAALGVVSSVAGMINPAAIAKTALIALAGVSLIPLIASASQALGVIALLPGVLAAAAAGGAALLIGSNGISDAFSAMSAESSSAGGAVEDMARKQQDALDSVSDAQQRVVDSQRSETQAIMRAKDAQQSLNDARKDAKNAIDDMNLSLKQGELSEEAAVLSVFRARQRLQEARMDPKSTGLDLAEASLGVRQAEQSVTEVRVRNSQKRVEARDVNSKGVEGSDQVVGATRDLAEAQYGVTTAQRDSERAARDLVKAQQDAAKAMESAASGGVNKLEEALAKLSPEARKFVEAMRDLGPAWSDLRKAVQDKLFEGLGDSVTELADAQLPTLQTGLEGIAGVINDNLRGALEALSTDAISTDLATIFENSRVAIDNLMAGLGNLGGAFLDIATVGSDFLPGLTGPDGFLGWTERFAAKIKEMRDSGALKDFIQGAIDKFGELWSIGGQVVGIIGSIFGSSKETGDSMLVSISETLQDWKDFLDSESGQTKMRGFFEGIRDALVTISEVIVAAVNAVRYLQGKAPLGADGSDPSATFDPAKAPAKELKPGEGGNSKTAPKPGSEFAGPYAIDLVPKNLNGPDPKGEKNAVEKRNENDRKSAERQENDYGLFGGTGAVLDSVAQALTLEVDDKGRTPFRRLTDWMFGGEEDNDTSRPEASGGSFGEPEGNANRVGGGARGAGARPEDYAALERELGITDEALDGTRAKVEETQGTFANLRTSIGESLEGVQPKFDAFKLRVGEIATDAFNNITNGAGFSWSGLGNTITNVIDTVTGGAFTRLKDGVSGVKDFFSGMSSSISSIWDGVVAVIKKAVGSIGRLLQRIEPISVLGIKIGPDFQNLGNSLVAWAGSTEAPVQMLPNVNGTQIGANGPVSTRAAGGPIVGAGTATSDSIPALLSNGEHVLTAAEVKAAGGQGAVYRLREAIRNGTVGRFAIGGAVQWGDSGIDRSIYDAAVAEFGENGVTVTSALRPGASGHHGTGTAVDLDGPDKQSIADFFFKAFPDMAQLIYGPGPLLYNDRGTTVDPSDQAQLRSIYAGDLPGHFDHVHLAAAAPLGSAGSGGSYTPNEYGIGTGGLTPLDGGNYSPTGTYVGPATNLGYDSAEAPTVPTLSEIGGKIGTAIGAGLPQLLGLEGTFFDDPANSTVGRAYSIFSAPRVAGQDPFAQRPTGDLSGLGGTTSGDSGYTPPSTAGAITTGPLAGPASGIGRGSEAYDPSQGAEQWQPEALLAIERTGQNVGSLAATLQQIQFESGGNPTIIQGVQDVNSGGNEAQGLLQVIPNTFAAMRDPELPNDRTHPLANLVAGINWVTTRWGGIEERWPTRGGYATGGPVVGPGTGTSDSIPTRLSNGEFVMRASAVNAETLPILQAMNAGQSWAANAAANAQQFRRQPAMAGASSNSRSEDWSMNFGDVHTTDPRAFRAEVETAMSRRFRSYTGGLR